MLHLLSLGLSSSENLPEIVKRSGMKKEPHHRIVPARQPVEMKRRDIMGVFFHDDQPFSCAEDYFIAMIHSICKLELSLSASPYRIMDIVCGSPSRHF